MASGRGFRKDGVVPTYHHKCRLCGTEWDSLKKHPVACPACKSYFWDKARNQDKKEDDVLLIQVSPFFRQMAEAIFKTEPCASCLRAAKSGDEGPLQKCPVVNCPHKKKARKQIEKVETSSPAE